jgi:hypothetical protein
MASISTTDDNDIEHQALESEGGLEVYTNPRTCPTPVEILSYILLVIYVGITVINIVLSVMGPRELFLDSFRVVYCPIFPRSPSLLFSASRDQVDRGLASLCRLSSFAPSTVSRQTQAHHHYGRGRFVADSQLHAGSRQWRWDRPGRCLHAGCHGS